MHQLVALFLAAFFVLPFPVVTERAASKAEDRLVNVKGQIHLDDTSRFTFKSLSVFVQYRRDKDQPWKAIGSITPDKDGRFVVPILAGSRVSVEVTTSDPTVRRSTGTTEPLEFYAMEFNRRVTVLQQEFMVPDDASESVEPTFELQRGAAFKVCFPNGLKSGAVHFRRQVERYEDGVNVWTFSDPTSTSEAILGGLVPGPWQVSIVDNNDAELVPQPVDLQRAQVSQMKCE